MRYSLLIPCILVIAIAHSCNSHSHSNTTGKSTLLTDKWYKHFTGTIAGKRVQADIYLIDSEISGAYCFDEAGTPFSLSNIDDTIKSDDTLYLYEENKTGKKDYNIVSHWKVILQGNKLIGKYLAADGNIADINLIEDYGNGSCRMNVVTFDTGIRVRTSSAFSSYLLTILNNKNADKQNAVFENAIDRLLSYNDTATGNYTNYIRLNCQENFEYLIEIDSLQSPSDDSFSIIHKNIIKPIYNKGNIVTLEYFRLSEPSDAAHASYASYYSCLDMQEKRIWRLTDILNVDTLAISYLLEKSAETDGLTERLDVGPIPITENVYFTNKGLVFSYNPYGIASFADGQVEIFVSFSELSSMLTTAFKTRMNIKS